MPDARQWRRRRTPCTSRSRCDADGALSHIVKINRRGRKCRMLGNGDDGVLLVRLGAVVTQTVLYITPIGKRKGGTLLCTKF